MFCPQCGSNVSKSAVFCPHCGEQLKESKDFLDESSSIINIPDAEPDIDLFFEGNVKTINIIPSPVNKIALNLKNNSLNPIYNVKVHLSGPPQIEILDDLINVQIIEPKATISTPISIISNDLGIFTINAKLESSIDKEFEFNLEIRTTSSKSFQSREITLPSATKTSMPSPWASKGTDTAVIVLVIFALFGIILMISGIASFVSMGLPFSAGITLLIIGFIFLSIGTKGKCLIFPCYCACDDCDCDC